MFGEETIGPFKNEMEVELTIKVDPVPDKKKNVGPLRIVMNGETAFTMSRSDTMFGGTCRYSLQNKSGINLVGFEAPGSEETTSFKVMDSSGKVALKCDA